MTYEELVAYLERNWLKSTVAETVTAYPFDELRDLLADRGHPERGLTVVHVTGSKGKGSIVEMAAALLRAHGAATGTYTSPHLIHVEERIRGADGATIPRGEFARRMGELIALSRGRGHDPRSTIRLMLIAGLEHWQAIGVTHAAVEVSIGGRFDHTNILEGQTAAIAPIGLEHVPRLGRTLADIAAQKVAIVKPGRLCVSAPQTPAVTAVMEAGVALAGGRLAMLGRDFHAHVRALDSSGLVADLSTPHRCFGAVRIGLLGRHQAENAAVALCAAESALVAQDRQLEPAAVTEGFARVRWPGRLELLRRDPPLLYDAAHTAESARTLANAMTDHFPDVRWTFVVGVGGHRDPAAFLAPLAGRAERVVAVPLVGSPHVVPADAARGAKALGVTAEVAGSVGEALARAAGPVCVTGSLYLYAEAALHCGRTHLES